jgi:hypothetical protein
MYVCNTFVIVAWHLDCLKEYEQSKIKLFLAFTLLLCEHVTSLSQSQVKYIVSCIRFFFGGGGWQTNESNFLKGKSSYKENVKIGSFFKSVFMF